MVMKDIKISQEMKNKSWLSCDEMRKTKSLRNYKKFDKPNYWFFETDLVGWFFRESTEILVGLVGFVTVVFSPSVFNSSYYYSLYLTFFFSVDTQERLCWTFLISLTQHLLAEKVKPEFGFCQARSSYKDFYVKSIQIK